MNKDHEWNRLVRYGPMMLISGILLTFLPFFHIHHYQDLSDAPAWSSLPGLAVVCVMVFFRSRMV